jgi:tetratricopeptide (TPR) repeat protein
MVKKIMLRQKKVKKHKTADKPVTKIVKKPYTEKERLEKLRQDRLKIARRYEEMRLYDEAISYYKKLGMADDVERVFNTKKDVYSSTAKEFENLGKYEDAARLYENLNMTEEVSRLRKLLGDDDYELDTPSTSSTIAPAQEPLKQNSEEPILNEPVYQTTEYVKDSEMVSTKVFETDQVKISPGSNSNKIFRICPYCAEELNLPKKPNFCPYCKEPFV